MLRTTRAIALVVSVSLVAPLAPPAFAQAPSAVGDTHLKKGKELFAKKSYAEARASFAAAYEASPSGHAAYWAGRASQELHEPDVAADWYTKALAAGKLAPGEDAAARFDSLKNEPVTVVFETQPDGATVRVDGKEFAQKTPFFVHLTPGRHHIVAEVSGKTAERDVDIPPFKKTRLELTIDAAEAPAKEPPKPIEPPKAPVAAPKETTPEPEVVTRHTPLARRLSYITAGGAVVALGLGTMYGLKALSDDRAYEKHPDPQIEDIGRRHALVSDVCFALGVGLAVTSVVLYFTSREPRTVAIAPTITPTFAGGGLSVRF